MQMGKSRIACIATVADQLVLGYRITYFYGNSFVFQVAVISLGTIFMQYHYHICPAEISLVEPSVFKTTYGMCYNATTCGMYRRTLVHLEVQVKSATMGKAGVITLDKQMRLAGGERKRIDIAVISIK
jgi:hypothetical protein